MRGRKLDIRKKVEPCWRIKMALNPNATVKQIPFSPRAIYARTAMGAIALLLIVGLFELWKYGITPVLVLVFVVIAYASLHAWNLFRVYYDVTDKGIEADRFSGGIVSGSFFNVFMDFGTIKKVTVEQDITERLFGLYHVRFLTGNWLFDMTAHFGAFAIYPHRLGSFEKKDAEKLKALVESKMKLAKKN